MPDPVVIRCPACQHLLSVPEDFLGRVVTCLECHAAFESPARSGDTLTAARLIRRGRQKVAPLVFVPMLGLLLLGTAGVLVNGYLYIAPRHDPEVARSFVRGVLWQQAKEAPDDEPQPKGPDGKPIPLTEEEQSEREARRRAFLEEQERRIEERAEAAVADLGAMQGPFALVSLGVLAGGIAFALRRFYWLAFVGCFLAVVNFNHACCVPGALVGIWGFFALISDDGRRHFGLTKV
jgi:hypothetical protein